MVCAGDLVPEGTTLVTPDLVVFLTSDKAPFHNINLMKLSVQWIRNPIWPLFFSEKDSNEIFNVFRQDSVGNQSEVDFTGCQCLQQTVSSNRLQINIFQNTTDSKGDQEHIELNENGTTLDVKT